MTSVQIGAVYEEILVGGAPKAQIGAAYTEALTAGAPKAQIGASYVEALIPTYPWEPVASWDASSEQVGYEAANAGNNLLTWQDSGTGWRWASAAAGMPQWLRATLPSPKVIKGYMVQPGNWNAGGGTQDPSSWLFQGWDGSSWVTLDSRSGVTFTNQAQWFRVSNNTTAYTQHRLYITATGGATTVSIGELRLYTTDEFRSYSFNLYGGSINAVNGTFTVGQVFRVARPGWITHLTFFEGTAATTLVTLNLYDESSVAAATTTYQQVSGRSGWATVELASPVRVVPGREYMATAYIQNSSTSISTLSAAVDQVFGDIIVPANGTCYHDGLTSNYRYAASLTKPTNAGTGVHYCVGPVFYPDASLPDISDIEATSYLTLKAENAGAVGSSLTSGWADESPDARKCSFYGTAATVAGAGTPSGERSVRFDGATRIDYASLLWATDVYGSAFTPDKAFDGSTATYYHSQSTTGTRIFHMGAKTASTVTGYSIQVVSNSGPGTWTFEGSNDDVNWTTLDSQSGITWGATELKSFSFANSTPYKHYRFVVTSAPQGYLRWSEVTLTGTTYTPETTNRDGELWVVLRSDSVDGTNTNNGVAFVFGTSTQMNHWPYQNGSCYDDTAGGTRISFAPGRPVSRWVIYRVKVSGTTRRFYLNGILKATSSDTINWNTTPSVGGGWQATNYLFKGDIAYVCAPTVALTDEQAARMHTYLHNKYLEPNRAGEQFQRQRSMYAASTTTGWAPIDDTGQLDVRIPASAGDWVQLFYGDAWVDATGVAPLVDIAVMRRGSPAVYLSSGTATPATYGIPSFLTSATVDYQPARGSTYYQVQQSDIYDGLASFRLYQASTGAKAHSVEGNGIHFQGIKCDSAPVSATLPATTFNTTPANVSGADLVIPAAAGDIIAITTQMAADNTAGDLLFDAVTIVGGSVNRYISGATGPSGDKVIPVWRARPLSTNTAIPGYTHHYQVDASDVVGGNVTFRLRGWTWSGSRAFLGTANKWWARKVA